jgi:hypothetical protein
LFFEGRGSIASVNQEKFESSLPNDPTASLELEVPSPMTATVATAVSDIQYTYAIVLLKSLTFVHRYLVIRMYLAMG